MTVENENVENENVEIITKTPEKKVKIKDPKRVEAGKKLSMYNKKAKQDKRKVEEQETFIEQKSYLPSLVQISGVFGIIVMSINIFLGYKQIYPEQPKEQFLEPEKQNPVEAEKPKVIFGME